MHTPEGPRPTVEVGGILDPLRPTLLDPPVLLRERWVVGGSLGFGRVTSGLDPQLDRDVERSRGRTGVGGEDSLGQEDGPRQVPGFITSSPDPSGVRWSGRDVP